ncbi:M15 family metallopeptidase [Lysobacter sp. A3-1-A15]|uniref:M15 family metallopeptidase n=1 Tax=Novilysobacter viscosus TaxID=3098602 RepID=UPI002ED80A9C
MSERLFRDDVLFTQRLLAADGLYRGAIDGLWGPITEAAWQGFQSRSRALRTRMGEFDLRSEAAIGTLALPAQAAARASLRRILDGGFQARIISGTRTWAQQNALFRQGRYGNPGPVVTRARGGQSTHNFGIAWDIGLFTGAGGYVTDAAAYASAAQHGKGAGVEWGGDWTGFPDPSHYQLATGDGIATLRMRFQAGLGLA